jgi:GTPase
MSPQNKHLLFIGNPGAGKSTLLNCIMRDRNSGELREDQMFKSGISYGSGMTLQLHTEQITDTIFMDTPGLEDSTNRKEAAEAITEALKKNGYYQVVFVLTLESGRVRPSDVATITLVLESASEIIRYGVIFNKLGKNILSSISHDIKMKILTEISLGSGPNKPVPVPLFLRNYPELYDKNNAITAIPELKDFLSKLIPLKINSGNVMDISTNGFEALNMKMAEKIAFLKANNIELQKKMKEDEEYFDTKFQNALEKEKTRQENERQEIRENHEHTIKNMEEQLEKTKHERSEEKRKETSTIVEELSAKHNEELLKELQRDAQSQESTIQQQKDQPNESITTRIQLRKYECFIM